MTAEFQDEVDGLTLGQCVDHPKWSPQWTIERCLPIGFRIYDANLREFWGVFNTAVESARDALKTLLPQRPPKVVVTEEDCAFARKLAVTYGSPIGKPWWEVVAPLIAAYRVKHSGGAK